MKFSTPNIIELRLAMATQGRDNVREYLNGIHINFVDNKLTATDGAIISQSTIILPATHDAPESLIVHIDGTVPKRATLAVFEVDGSTGTVALFKEDVLIKTLPVKVIDDTYPDTSGILDTAGMGQFDVRSVSFDAVYITRIIQAIGSPVVKLEFAGAGSPIGIRLYSLPKTEVRLMPARL